MGDRTGATGIPRRRFLAASAGVVVGSAAASRGAVAMGMGMGTASGRRFDAVVVGAGPAGLSAALVLGRARRSTLLCDGGPGRNAPAEGVHGFLGHDGTPPAELRRVALAQLRPYGVAVHQGEVAAARRSGDGLGFDLTLATGEAVHARRLILATGVVDDLPAIPGLRESWGAGVIHCPYCHGWETRDRPWALLVAEEMQEEVAPMLLNWARSLTLLTHGAPGPAKPEFRAWLGRHGVPIETARVERVEAEAGGRHLAAVHLDGGRRLDVATLFLGVRARQRSPLAEALGCEFVAEGRLAGTVRADNFGATNVPGLFVVGDASGVGVPSVASAVAEGSVAAAMASRGLFSEDFA